jgi:DNA-binding GntR family transcriptional regulator
MAFATSAPSKKGPPRNRSEPLRDPLRGSRRGSSDFVGNFAESVEAARLQSEEAYLRIRERIVSLEMPPGSVVNESRLREELKIGRTPIREALQRLARENLVRSIPHRGTFVTDVNITDLARITEVRVVLEAHAARLAAEKLAASDRESIEQLLDVVLNGRISDQRDLMRLDQKVHRQVYRAARNSFLEATLERYFNLSLRLWYLVLDREVRLREAVDEHVELLDAILAGDAGRAEEIMRRHVIGFEREIRKVLVER